MIFGITKTGRVPMKAYKEAVTFFVPRTPVVWRATFLIDFSYDISASNFGLLVEYLLQVPSRCQAAGGTVHSVLLMHN